MGNKWLAITSLIIAILGSLSVLLGGIGLIIGPLTSILAIIFGTIFLVRKENEEGKWLAIIGITIGVIVLLLSILIFIIASSFGFPFLS